MGSPRGGREVGKLGDQKESGSGWDGSVKDKAVVAELIKVWAEECGVQICTFVGHIGFGTTHTRNHQLLLCSTSSLMSTPLPPSGAILCPWTRTASVRVRNPTCPCLPIVTTHDPATHPRSDMNTVRTTPPCVTAVHASRYHAGTRVDVQYRRASLLEAQ